MVLGNMPVLAVCVAFKDRMVKATVQLRKTLLGYIKFKPFPHTQDRVFSVSFTESSVLSHSQEAYSDCCL